MAHLLAAYLCEERECDTELNTCFVCLAAKKVAAANSSASASGTSTPRKTTASPAGRSGAKPVATAVSQLRNEFEALDAGGMGRGASSTGSVVSTAGSNASTPLGIAHERIVEEYRKREKEGKAELSLVVVGECGLINAQIRNGTDFVC